MQTSNYYDFQALNQPDPGLWKDRRNEHNRVKYILLQYALCRVKCRRIADLACGKGGDLNKYRALCPSASVTCVDNSAISLDVLRQRFHGSECMIDSIMHADAANVKIQANSYDIVVVNFALHYFCDTKEHLCQLLKTISSSLRNGGMFFGTCVDYRMLRHKHDHIQCSEEVLTDIEKNPWGRAYRYFLPECVDAEEYVVYFPEVVSIAHRLQMHLVKIQSFNGFLFANEFNPTTPKANSPYMVFVFTKSSANG